MNMISKELLLRMPVDLPCLIEELFSRAQKRMLFQANVSIYFIQRFQLKQFVCKLLDVIQDEGL